LVRAVVQALPNTRFEYCVLRSFSDSGINFEVCYFVPGTPPRLHLDTLDAANRGILAAFDRESVKFASPTRVVVLQSPPRE
jgi:small-conductance mechanosensitive channel